MKFLRILTIVLCFAVGFLGMAGGYAALSNPQGPFGIPTDILKNGPFDDFLIPGITLFVVIGLGQLGTGIALIRKAKLHQYILGAMGAVTLGWIIIQCFIMEEINFMHVAIFIVGSLQGLHALSLLYAENLFPMDWVRKRLAK
ncbi:MAG: hypothetical protein AB1407_13255 [Spirochaetota bacterium]